MSSELEAAGALLTAGLAASEVEASAPPGAAAAHGLRCANCGAALAGNLCSACGQPAHVHRSLLHLAEEVLHGVFAALWRMFVLLSVCAVVLVLVLFLLLIAVVTTR